LFQLLPLKSVFITVHFLQNSRIPVNKLKIVWQYPYSLRSIRSYSYYLYSIGLNYVVFSQDCRLPRTSNFRLLPITKYLLIPVGFSKDCPFPVTLIKDFLIPVAFDQDPHI
jgi:hypothetical protein